MYLVIFKRWYGEDVYHNDYYNSEIITAAYTEDKALEFIEKVKSGDLDIFIPNMEFGKFEILNVDIYN